MKRLLAFFFLFVYLLNQAAYAMPAFTSVGMTYEFKKKCKYGKKDKQIKKSASGKTTLSDEHKKSDKKVVSFCSADVHIHHESRFSFFIPEETIHHQVYKTAVYSCSCNIHSPPPCFL